MRSSPVERFSDKEEVEGSIPSAPTRADSLMEEHRICTAEVRGSSPLRSTIKFSTRQLFFNLLYSINIFLQRSRPYKS